MRSVGPVPQQRDKSPLLPGMKLSAKSLRPVRASGMSRRATAGGAPGLYAACGHCKHCLGGGKRLCEEPQNTAYYVKGRFADAIERLESIDAILPRMHHGDIQSRIIIDFGN